MKSQNREHYLSMNCIRDSTKNLEAKVKYRYRILLHGSWISLIAAIAPDYLRLAARL